MEGGQAEVVCVRGLSAAGNMWSGGGRDARRLQGRSQGWLPPRSTLDNCDICEQSAIEAERRNLALETGLFCP